MKVYDVNTPLNYFRPEVTPDILLKGIKKLKPTSPLATIEVAKAFVSSCERWNLDQVYLTAHAALESAWGTSRIAIDKNNLFGYRAYDSSPYLSASTFKTKEACILFIAEFVSRQYLQPTGKWYSGASTLAAMNKYYATATHWSKSIADIANKLEEAMFKDTASILDPNNQPVPVVETKVENLVKHTRNVVITAQQGVNVRVAANTKEKNIAQTLPYNSTIQVDGYLVGEEVNGNNLWWKIKDKDYFIWTGATNYIPKPSSEEGIASVDSNDLSTLSTADLIKEVETYKNKVKESETYAKAQEDAIKKLNKELEIRDEEIIKLGIDLTNYENTKKINTNLSDQIEVYKKKIIDLNSSLTDSFAKAFEGWDLFQINKGPLGIASLPIVGFKLFTLLKGTMTDGYVIGWKKGGRILNVNAGELVEK